MADSNVCKRVAAVVAKLINVGFVIVVSGVVNLAIKNTTSRIHGKTVSSGLAGKDPYALVKESIVGIGVVRSSGGVRMALEGMRAGGVGGRGGPPNVRSSRAAERGLNAAGVDEGALRVEWVAGCARDAI